MKQDAAVKAIQIRWMTLWPGLSGSIPFVFDNDVADELATYARVRIKHLDEVQQTMGGPGARKFLNTGLIDVELHGPGNQGRFSLDVVSGWVRDVFQAVRFGMTGAEEGVVTYATTAVEVPRSSSAQFWVIEASTPFEYFDVR